MGFGSFGLLGLVQDLSNKVQEAHLLCPEARRIILSEDDSRISGQEQICLMVETELNRRQALFCYTYVSVRGMVAFDVEPQCFEDDTVKERP